MIISLLKNLFTVQPKGETETLGQGAQAFEKKAKAKLVQGSETDGIFLPEEARRKSLDALKKSQELFASFHKEGSQLDRLRLRFGVRKKVRKSIDDAFDMPELLDEITEKIFEAAKNDKHLRDRFRS